MLVHEPIHDVGIGERGHVAQALVLAGRANRLSREGEDSEQNQFSHVSFLCG